MPGAVFNIRELTSLYSVSPAHAVFLLEWKSRLSISMEASQYHSYYLVTNF